MLHDQTLFLTQLVTLVTVLDPIGHLTLFLAATPALSPRERRATALRAVPVAATVLIVSGVGGGWVLHAMGVSLLSFQIAGGLILFVFSLSMVLGNHEQGPGDLPDSQVASVAIYPVAVPIIAGPGSILSVIVLMDNNRGSVADQAVTVLALLIILAVLLGTFLLGEQIIRRLGTGGVNLLRRVMGLVLAALSVNLVLNAFATWLGLTPI